MDEKSEKIIKHDIEILKHEVGYLKMEVRLLRSTVIRLEAAASTRTTTIAITIIMCLLVFLFK